MTWVLKSKNRQRKINLLPQFNKQQNKNVNYIILFILVVSIWVRKFSDKIKRH